MKLSQINVNNNQNQIIIGPGQFKKSIIGTLSDNLVNDKGPDGKYIISNSSTATASAADYTYRISSVTEGTTCQFWSFMTPPFSERDNILRFLNSNNELVSFSVNTMTLLDNGNINNHEYATYQLIVPDSAVKVEFNIYVAHDSYAFWKQLYTTDDETYLVKWLAISPNGLPEIPKEKLPNTIYDISANDILEGSYGLNTETIIPTFTNGYYLTTNNNYTITKNTY